MTQKSVPEIRGLPLVGVAFDFQRDPLNFLKKLWKENGDIFKFKLGLQDLYFVNRPEYIYQILQKNQKNYDKKNIMYREMAILFGEATSVVDGERWKRGHNLIQPSFSYKRIEQMSPLLIESIEGTAKSWAEKSKRGETVDASEDLARMTLNIIVNSMFGQTIQGQEEKVTRCFKVIIEIIVARILSVFNFPVFVPTPQNLRYRKAIKQLDALIYEIIQKKLDSKGEKNEGYQDMLSQWIEASDKPNINMSSVKALRDEVIGIFVAGHGSSATFLSWILYHVAVNHQVQSKVNEELKAILAGRTPSYGDLAQLTYVTSVIEESMRITPPGWLISRTTIEKDVFGDFEIPPRSMILISPYFIQHHPEFWPEPETFDPSRFAEDKEEQIKKAAMNCAYIPFSAGQRVCAGRNMAMIEALFVVSILVGKFKLKLKSGHSVTPIGSFTLNLGGRLLLDLEPRN